MPCHDARLDVLPLHVAAGSTRVAKLCRVALPPAANSKLLPLLWFQGSLLFYSDSFRISFGQDRLDSFQGFQQSTALRGKIESSKTFAGNTEGFARIKTYLCLMD